MSRATSGRPNVLLYSHVFDPMVGGVETVSRMLAEGLVARGVACRVVTQTPAAAGEAAEFPFEVVRRPDARRVRELVRWADVVLFNGASLAMQPWVLLSRKPFVWVHVGYQACSIDGLGWVDNGPTPLTPWASFVFHLRRAGLRRGLLDGAKLMVRRAVALHGATRNVAITRWMAQKLPLPRQVLIYNPFPVESFRPAAGQPADHDFFFLGRLVQEKGVGTLIRAFATVVRRSATPPRLLLIGDGAERPVIEALVDELGLRPQVTFAGKQSGPALLAWVARGRIGVLPSIWYEPMGGVAVELLAAGKALIVSEAGGLAECVGDAGLVFPNGDDRALAGQMQRLLDEPEFERALAARASERATAFAPGPFLDQYLALLQQLHAP